MSDITTPKKKHKTLKWVLGIVGVLILLAGGVAWYINLKWKPLLTTAIQDALINASDSLYTIKFSDIEVNILTGSAIVDSIKISPDLTIYEKMKLNGTAPENIFSLKVFKLSLKNVKPLKVYQQKKLDIKNITIQNPELSVYYTKLNNQNAKKEDNRTPYERINKSLKELKIASIFLTDVKFKYVDQSYRKPKVTSFDQMNIRLNDILVDSTSHLDSSRIFSTKDVIAEINNYSYATPDSLYRININHAYVSSQNKQLKISGMELEPRLGEMQFSAQFKKQNERYKISFDSILVNDIRFHQLIDRRRLKSSHVTLSNGNVAVFLNRAKPPKTIDKGVNFPNLALQRLKWNVVADTVVIKNTSIAYAEYNPKTESKGTVYFKRLNGRIFNVTNDTVALQKNNVADAYIQTYLMDKGKIDIHIAFNLQDKKGAFSYDGTLGPMNLTALNPLTKPLSMLTTNSGQVQSMDFNIKGNVDGAKGKLVLKYTDLNIGIMKKGDDDNLKKSGFISFLANALLVDNANPKGNDPLRIAYPTYQRPHDASFFNLMWKTVFEGLKTSVGITKDKENKLKQRAEKYKQDKAARQERKQKRKEKREERKKE
ncbi:MAG TPA: hypothetical protein VF273_11205 [Pelobium sp.]